MANPINRPPVQTPKPQRDDLQRLIPENVRLRRALEQLFTDVNQTLPDAIQYSGDNGQAASDEALFLTQGSTDRRLSRIATYLADALQVEDGASIKSVAARVADVERLASDRVLPVRPRVPAFIAPTLTNTWVNFGSIYNPAGYYKDPFGIVHLRGMVKSGTVGAAMFTLPAGFLPQNTELFVVNANDAIGRLEISNAGAVTLQVGSNGFVSLDGLTFRAI